jgi:hypothetical protein
MKNNDLQQIVELRTHLVEFYQNLGQKRSPGADIGILKQSDVAAELEQLIRKVDSVLRPYVNFE